MATREDPTAADLDQLAQSLAVDGSLGRADTLRIVEVLPALAAARRATPHLQIRRKLCDAKTLRFSRSNSS